MQSISKQLLRKTGGGSRHTLWFSQSNLDDIWKPLLVLYTKPESLGVLLRYFISLYLCICSEIIHPLPRVTSTCKRAKLTIISLINNKPPTHTKLHHSACRRSMEKLSTLGFTQRNFALTSIPRSFD